MDLKYPIGKFIYTGDEDRDVYKKWIEDIAWLPERIRDSIEGCSDHDLDVLYRENGWSAKELISHLLDSHLNAIMRIKLALTEDNPTIRPYEQDSWVEAEQIWESPLELDLSLLEGIHEKLARMFTGFSKKDLERTYVNPESGEFSLRKAAALYAWHSNHHLAHINIITQKAKS